MCSINRDTMAGRRMTIEQACEILAKSKDNKGTTDSAKCETLKRFARELKQTDALKLLNNYKAIEAFINGLKGRGGGELADNSKKTYYTTLKTYADALKCSAAAIKFYTEQMDHYKQKAEDDDDLSKIPAKFNGKLPTIDEMKAVLDKFKGKAKNGELHTIAAMYTLIPPRRLEYRKVVYLSKKPNDAPIVKPPKAAGDSTEAGVPYNYIYPDGDKYVMVLGDYKTDRDYGVYQTELPADLSAIIKAYITKKEIKNNERLFSTLYGNEYSSGSFSKKLTSAFQGKYPVSITIDDLRHIFASGLDSATTTFARRKAIANAMAHSVEMQIRYTKNNAALLEEAAQDAAQQQAPQEDHHDDPQEPEPEPEQQQEEAPAPEEPQADNNDDVEIVAEPVTKADVLAQMHRYYKLKADYMARKIALLDKMI